MESLQTVSKLFHITLDELLSTEEIIVIAENENKGNIKHFAFFIDYILNLSAILGLLLPLYKEDGNGGFLSVPLYQLGGWQGIAFWIAPVLMIFCGILQMFLIGREQEKLHTAVSATGIAIHICGVLLLILSSQPYPAVLFFFLFVMKGVVLLKNHR